MNLYLKLNELLLSLAMRSKQGSILRNKLMRLSAYFSRKATAKASQLLK